MTTFIAARKKNPLPTLLIMKQNVTQCKAVGDQCVCVRACMPACVRACVCILIVFGHGTKHLGPGPIYDTSYLDNCLLVLLF